MTLNMSDDITSLPDLYWWWPNQVALAREFLLTLHKFRKYADPAKVPYLSFGGEPQSRLLQSKLHFWEKSLWNHSVTTYQSVPRGSLDANMQRLLLTVHDQIGAVDENLGRMALLLTRWKGDVRIIGQKPGPRIYSPFFLPDRSFREYSYSTGNTTNCLIHVDKQLLCHEETIGGENLVRFGLLAQSELASISGVLLRDLALKLTQHSGAMQPSKDDWHFDRKNLFGFTVPKCPILPTPQLAVVDSSDFWPELVLSSKTTGWIATFHPPVFDYGWCRCCGQALPGEPVRLFASHPRRFLVLVAYGTAGSPPVGCGWIVGEASESSRLTL